jgi:DNA-binding NtrC family response regulator
MARARAAGDTEVSVHHLDEQAGRRIQQLSSSVPVSAPLERSAQRDPAVERLLGLAANKLGLAQKTLQKLVPGDTLRALAGALGDAQALQDATIESLRSSAREALAALFMAHEGNRTAVAAALGTSRTTLLKLVEELGLQVGSPG